MKINSEPKKITYLLGAGASAGRSKFISEGQESQRFHVLPPVAKLGEQMSYVATLLKGIAMTEGHILREIYLRKDFLIEYNGQNYNYFSDELKYIQPILVKLSNDIENLAKKNKEFGTIDTYAKHLWNIGNFDALKVMKKTFSTYLLLEQLMLVDNQNIPDLNEFIFDLDIRYLTNITSLMQQDGFPKDQVKYLTWNYDSQFELAFAKSHNDKDFLNNYKNISDENDLIFHLNGRASKLEDDLETSFDFISSYYQNQKVRKDIPILLETIINYLDLKTIKLDFAFEKKDNIFDNLIEINKNAFISHLSQSEILVVIGYSFPYFNREIDKQIIDYMTGDVGKLRKIYIQTKDKEFEKLDLLNQFNFLKNSMITENDIVVIHNCDNFLIPKEL